MISLFVYGSNKCAIKMDRTSFSHIITSEWEYKMTLSISRSEADKQVKYFVRNMDSRIRDEFLPLYTLHSLQEMFSIAHIKMSSTRNRHDIQHMYGYT